MPPHIRQGVFERGGDMSNTTYEQGYAKAMAITGGDTYMYSSSRRISEVAAKDESYESATYEYRVGFADAIYDLFRC